MSNQYGTPLAASPPSDVLGYGKFISIAPLGRGLAALDEYGQVWKLYVDSDGVAHEWSRMPRARI